MGKKLVFSTDQINAATDRLAEQINSDYQGRELLLVVVLNGAFIFSADLVRKLTVPLTVDFIKLSSYSGTESTGKVSLARDLGMEVTGRHIMVVEDIIDTGLSLGFLLDTLRSRSPASIKVCTLVDKRNRRKLPIDADYAGLVCEGGFLIGYGLDLDGRFRELPAIYELSR